MQAPPWSQGAEDAEDAELQAALAASLLVSPRPFGPASDSCVCTVLLLSLERGTLHASQGSFFSSYGSLSAPKAGGLEPRPLGRPAEPQPASNSAGSTDHSPSASSPVSLSSLPWPTWLGAGETWGGRIPAGPGAIRCSGASLKHRWRAGCCPLAGFSCCRRGPEEARTGRHAAIGRCTSSAAWLVPSRGPGRAHRVARRRGEQ